MLNSRFGYSMKKNSFKGLNIDCIQYSNIIRITYYSYSYSGTILNPNIIRIRIRPNICARILFVFVFAHFEKTNIIRIRIRSKFWFRIIFVLVFGPKNSIRSPLDWLSDKARQWSDKITQRPFCVCDLRKSVLNCRYTCTLHSSPFRGLLWSRPDTRYLLNFHSFI